MRLKTPLVALSSAGLLALAACGGSGSSSGPASSGTFNGGRTGNQQDASATGPVSISGATKGGTVTVLTLTGLTTTIDPSESYYTDTSSILDGLITRSLTQYRYDPSSRPTSGRTTTATPSGSSPSGPG
jgi:peptide/nickel transport system substrate-binding protein